MHAQLKKLEDLGWKELLEPLPWFGCLGGGVQIHS